MMLKKSLIFLIFIFSVFSFNGVYGCEYQGEIDECVSANKSGTTNGIEDFICRVGNYEEIAYQIVLDGEFQIVDNEMDLYVEDLEKNKNYYFGVDRKKTYIDGINDIEAKREYFERKYIGLCGKTIISKVMSCMEDEKVSITNTKDFFKISECEKLVEKKLEIFNDVAFGVLMLNKKQIRTDEKKTYDQLGRKNYNMLLDIMMINLGYLERIWKKWPVKLANPI